MYLDNNQIFKNTLAKVDELLWRHYLFKYSDGQEADLLKVNQYFGQKMDEI